MNWKSISVEDLNEIARQIIASIGEPSVVLLRGEMGAGKTTLTKALLDVLGGGSDVSSPTFSIVNEYALSSGDSVYHFDLYRLESLEEALDIGIEEYLYSRSWCLIEWPDKILDLLDDAHWVINISVVDGERIIELSSST